ncbi:hypothetical protein CB1_007889002 [Camelus ferus]|nr:hypothetical protein CB1_007889002 [Camelus ferus]
MEEKAPLRGTFCMARDQQVEHVLALKLWVHFPGWRFSISAYRCFAIVCTRMCLATGCQRIAESSVRRLWPFLDSYSFVPPLPWASYLVSMELPRQKPPPEFRDQTGKKALSTNSELSTFRSDILDLRQQLREITEKTSKNKDTLEKLQASGDALVDQQSQLKETLENNSFLITTVNKTLQAYNGYVTDLQQDTSVLQGSLQTQMYSHSVVVMNLNNLNLTQVQQRDLITNLQRSVDDTSQAIQRIKNDFQNLQQVFLQAKKDTDWLKEKVQSLQTLAANNSALAKANNDTLEDMNGQLSSFAGQMDNITTASQANEQNLKDLQEVHRDAENRTAVKFSQLEERFQVFESDIVNIISNISYTAHHLRTLTSNLNEVRTTCTDTLTKHTDDLTSLNNTLANIRLDSVSLRMQQDMMRSRLDTEVANLSVIMEEMKLVDSKHGQLIKNFTILQANIECECNESLSQTILLSPDTHSVRQPGTGLLSTSMPCCPVHEAWSSWQDPLSSGPTGLWNRVACTALPTVRRKNWQRGQLALAFGDTGSVTQLTHVHPGICRSEQEGPRPSTASKHSWPAPVLAGRSSHAQSRHSRCSRRDVIGGRHGAAAGTRRRENVSDAATLQFARSADAVCDLLRRLSKSQNTVFCGRIQLFLARLFPLSEKSGLNLQSQFNLENVTVFNTNEQESTLGQKHTEDREEGMDVEEGEMGDDEAPTTCSIPIDYNLYRKFWSLQDYFRNPVQCYEKISWKTFLKLMDLQLSDSNFRRHILLQYLILFQYLKGQVKFKRTSDTKPARVARKRAAPEDFLGKGPSKKILMGKQGRRCHSEPVRFEVSHGALILAEYMPTLEEFFEEAIEQADPENMVENEYKAVNNSNYGWRALRLLARRSPHFFQPTNQQFKSLPEYLENMVIKLAKELPPPSEEIKTGEDEDEEDNDALLKENESPDVRRDKPVTGDQIEVFASKLGEQWKILAPYLEMKDSEIRQIECDSEDVKMRAKQLLVAWQDQEGAHATAENLINALNKSGLSDLAESLTNDNETNS